MSTKFKEIIKEITSIRQQLHKHPELSYKEFKTTELIKKTIEKWGLTYVPFKKLETGGYCEIGTGDTLLYRADIDALPIIENSSNDYASEVEGVMHACGHDFHTAIGLGILRYFQLFPENLPGKLRVVFQPAEEATPTGAAAVIKENIWKNAIAILGIHVNSEDPPGEFSLSKTAANGSNTTVQIQLKGPGGHTSRPDQSVDLILASCEYVTQLHSYLKNKIDPGETVSFSFGQIHGGQAKNAIPQSIELQGTLRTHSNLVLQKAKKLITDLSEYFRKLHNLKIGVDLLSSCPVTMNDPSLVEQFIDYYNTNSETEITILQKPSMGADDFAYYLDKVPGLYVRVGGAGKGAAHTGKFVVNEKLIAPAVRHITGFINYFFEKRKK
jgi:amidohydrolase